MCSNSPSRRSRIPPLGDRMPTTALILRILGGLTVMMSLVVLVVGQFEVGHQIAVQRGWLLMGIGGALFGAGLFFSMGSPPSLIILGSGGALEIAGAAVHSRWARSTRR
jgi:hypothetical protein